MDEGIEPVLDSDNLLRTAWYPDPSYIRDDMTVTSMAFRLRKNNGETGLSVDIERLTTWEKSIGDISRFRLFSVKCATVRSMGLECIHKPEPDNYAHAEIVGNITNSISGKLAKEAVYVPYP